MDSGTPISEDGLFDVEVFRARRHRSVVVRRIERPTLVLGSTQEPGVVDAETAAGRGVEVRTRRSGGGAVLLRPGKVVWIDTWVPRGDPLWDDDVGRSALWVGRWWAGVLAPSPTSVHRGRLLETRWSRLVCFAGVGPGEVVAGGRKVVGVAQWRGREGALTHSMAYLAVDWVDLVSLLAVGTAGTQLAADLTDTTATLSEMGIDDAPAFVRRLVADLPDPSSWEFVDQEL